MLDRSQYQYTPVTGPVWTEPVAARLAWLPRGQQPQRGLPPNQLGWYCRPEFAALYKPEGLQWLLRGQPPARSRPPHLLGWYCRPEFAALYRPERLEWLAIDRYAGRGLTFARRDWTVLLQLVSAPAFDPQRLEWMPQGRPWLTLPERRTIGDFAQPHFAALYRAERLEWQPEDSYVGRVLPRSLNDQTVFQQPPITAAFDPQRLEWVPQGVHWLARAERRALGDFAQPQFDALYRPDRLEWQPEDGYFGRAVQRVARDWTVFQPPAISAVFDPQTLEWVPRGQHWLVRPERRIVGDFAESIFAALYRPERFEWQPEDGYVGRAPRRSLLDWTVFPQPVVAVILTVILDASLRDQSQVLTLADRTAPDGLADRTPAPGIR